MDYEIEREENKCRLMIELKYSSVVCIYASFALMLKNNKKSIIEGRFYFDQIINRLQ